MKRRLFKLVVFLLLGAVVNVGVAWGCAMIVAEQTDNWNLRSGAARLEDDYVWLVYRKDRPGYFGKRRVGDPNGARHDPPLPAGEMLYRLACLTASLSLPPLDCLKTP